MYIATCILEFAYIETCLLSIGTCILIPVYWYLHMTVPVYWYGDLGTRFDGDACTRQGVLLGTPTVNAGGRGIQPQGLWREGRGRGGASDRSRERWVGGGGGQVEGDRWRGLQYHEQRTVTVNL